MQHNGELTMKASPQDFFIMGPIYLSQKQRMTDLLLIFSVIPADRYANNLTTSLEHLHIREKSIGQVPHELFLIHMGTCHNMGVPGGARQ